MQSVLSLARLTGMVKNIIERSAELQNLWVDGEISNLTIARSGHAYFNLKDAENQFRCVMWRSAVQKQRFPLREGDQVLVHGSVTMYAPRGELQLQVNLVQPQGTGLLQLQLEELRMKLEAEGLFDESRKRPLPTLPRTIGAVTAETGAVWHDIQRVVGRRYPLAKLVLSPTLVQGEFAPDAIVAALHLLQDVETPDVIIIGRGGGSIEDLWAFNDERVVRAIFASRVPIISAVGHENDFTLADDVADVRAGTPSMAAELATPDLVQVDAALVATYQSLVQYVQRLLNTQLERLDHLQRQLARLSPLTRLQRLGAEAESLGNRLALACRHNLAIANREVDALGRVLANLNPDAMFGRGYAFLENTSTDTPIRTVDGVTVGDPIRATVRGGHIRGTVDGIESTATAIDGERNA
jgi:exodeoxyribonuclease VII large subunit